MTESDSCEEIANLDTSETNNHATTKLVNQETSKAKLTKCKKTSKMVLYHMVRVTALVALIAWYVFDILAIVSVSPTHATHLCPASHLWDFMLMYVVIIGMVLLTCMLQENSKTYWCGVLFLSLALTVWGALELCIVACVNELTHTLLYKMVNINVVGAILAYFGMIMYGIFMT